MKHAGLYAIPLTLTALALQGCFEPAATGPEPLVVSALVGHPNLRITSATVTKFLASGLEYSYVLENNGTAGVADLYSVDIQNMYSPNTNFNDPHAQAAGGALLGVHVALPVGGTYNGKFKTLMFNPGGMNYLVFKIDNANSVVETNEGDNTKALSIVPKVKPDLAYGTAQINSKTSSGLKYGYVLTNNGPGDILDIYNIVIQNLYSVNNVFGDAGDLGAGGNILGVHAALPAGKSYIGTLTTSGAVPAGMKYLVFKIDYAGAVFETNEANNTKALLIP